jgi:hypothetical protein
MARPKKIGLDYFPIDTVFDEKIQILESKFGNDGLCWLFKFWQMAYKTETGEVNTELFGELLANQSRITTELQSNIIKLCEKLNLLYKTEQNYLTSNGIKKRISVVSHERKSAIQRQEERILRESKVKETPHYSPNNNKIEDRMSAFKESVFDFLPNYSNQMLTSFFEYWAEMNKTKTKMRFEKQETWDIKKRLKRWADNNFNFKTNNSQYTPNFQKSACEIEQDEINRKMALSLKNEVKNEPTIIS